MSGVSQSSAQRVDSYMSASKWARLTRPISAARSAVRDDSKIPSTIRTPRRVGTGVANVPAGRCS